MVFGTRARIVAVVVIGTAACDPQPTRVTATRDRGPQPDLLLWTVAAAPSLRIAPITVGVAEDGHGHRVAPPADPRALDVVASSWPGRALDPVLHVGDLAFHDYSFPSRDVMRFVVDDVARLRPGEEVWLQWGDDVASRIVLTRSLEVPK